MSHGWVVGGLLHRLRDYEPHTCIPLDRHCVDPTQLCLRWMLRLPMAAQASPDPRATGRQRSPSGQRQRSSWLVNIVDISKRYRHVDCVDTVLGRGLCSRRTPSLQCLSLWQIHTCPLKQLKAGAVPGVWRAWRSDGGTRWAGGWARPGRALNPSSPPMVSGTLTR